MERISGEETEVHGVRVVSGDEVEREKRDGEESDETVYTGALVWCEDLPPFDGAVCEYHGYVKRNHRRHDVVEVRRRYHLFFRRRMERERERECFFLSLVWERSGEEGNKE